MLKWLSVITLAALAAGIVVGALVAAGGDAGQIALLKEIGHLGDLWLNLLRMTVIPLVFCLLVTGVASVADAAATGRLAARAILVFAVLLAAATAFACIAFPLVLKLWPTDPHAASILIAGAGGQPVQAVAPPTLGEWLAALAPSNSIAAAAEGAVLPLVVFALFFGFAATQLPAQQRQPMVGLFRSIADTMIIIVRWVLYAAPLGVFALALGVGLLAGIGNTLDKGLAAIIGLIVQYMVIVSAVTAAIVPMAFLFALLWGRAPLGRFSNAIAPVLAVAMSSRSSLASLPLMVERSRDAMGVPDRVAGLVLPLAVAIFRMTSPVANLGVVFFCAAVYGHELSLQAIIVGGFVAIAISIGSVGLPGEISFIASVAPISLAMGVPIDLLGILVAVEAVPDIFRTLGNVSGDMAATAITARRQPVSPAEAPAAAPPG